MKVRPCPSCPDGNEWGANGPTGRACKICGGFAVTHLDGSHLTQQEFEDELGTAYYPDEVDEQDEVAF